MTKPRTRTKIVATLHEWDDPADFELRTKGPRYRVEVFSPAAWLKTFKGARPAWYYRIRSIRGGRILATSEAYPSKRVAARLAVNVARDAGWSCVEVEA